MTISETLDRQAMNADAAHQLWGSQRAPMTEERKAAIEREALFEEGMSGCKTGTRTRSGTSSGPGRFEPAGPVAGAAPIV